MAKKAPKSSKKLAPLDGPLPVSVQRAAFVLGVTEKTIRESIRAGMPTLSEGGKGAGNAAVLDLAAAVRWYYSDNALELAKTRLAQANAEAREMDNAERRAELADVNEVERIWTNAVMAMRSKFLSMPTKLAAQLTNIGEAVLIEARLRTELEAGLAELVDEADRISGSAPDAAGRSGEGEAAAEPVGERVGRRKAKAE